MLAFPEPLRAKLLAEARAAYPAECCGLLEGTRTDAGIRVLALHPTPNVAKDPLTGFLVAPEAHFHLLRTLRGTGRGIVGCYHSHPNGRPGPSPRDRATPCEDGFVWVIIVTGGKEAVAAFRAPDFAPLALRE